LGKEQDFPLYTASLHLKKKTGSFQTIDISWQNYFPTAVYADCFNFNRCISVMQTTTHPHTSPPNV